jgi:uncharacterized protein (DUF849 family)
LWLKKGVLATNEQLVERAKNIIEQMGAELMNAEEVRSKLKLNKRSPSL